MSFAGEQWLTSYKAYEDGSWGSNKLMVWSEHGKFVPNTLGILDGHGGHIIPDSGLGMK